MSNEAILCALNNAEWCDAVCRAHGVPGAFGSAIWTQMRRGPPYYSNAITLSPSEREPQRAAIDALCFALPGGFSVKDAFNCLDLADAGFRLLFNAEWGWLDPASAAALNKPDREWVRVEEQAELDAWEAAWAAAGSPAEDRVFPPSLLRDPGIAFLGTKRDGAFRAGCIANRSRGDVVGFSNFFAASEADRYRTDAVARVVDFAPGRPVVGYDRGEELAGLRSVGFGTVGRLRVWVND